LPLLYDISLHSSSASKSAKSSAAFLYSLAVPFAIAILDSSDAERSSVSKLEV